MLRQLIAGAFLAALVLLMTVPAQAASLGGGVGFTGDAIDVLDDGFGLTILNAGDPLTGAGLSGIMDNAFDLLIVGDSLNAADPTVALFLDGADGSLAGLLRSFSVGTQTATLLFTLSQDGCRAFGGAAVVTLTGDFSAGLDALDAHVTIAPIPLPATLPLMAAAFAMLARARRGPSAR